MVITFQDELYELDTDKITLNQAMFIKSKTGMGLKSWQNAVSDADPDAIKALYWLMMDQSGKRVVWERIDFPVVEFFSAFADAAAEAEDLPEGVTPIRP